MTEDEEYIKFWYSIKTKADEIQRDYNALSAKNRYRSDMALQSILEAKAIAEMLNIANSQLR